MLFQQWKDHKPFQDSNEALDDDNNEDEKDNVIISLENKKQTKDSNDATLQPSKAAYLAKLESWEAMYAKQDAERMDVEKTKLWGFGDCTTMLIEVHKSLKIKEEEGDSIESKLSNLY